MRHAVYYPAGVFLDHAPGTVLVDGILRPGDPFVFYDPDGNTTKLWVATTEIHIPYQPHAPVASAEVEITLTLKDPNAS